MVETVTIGENGSLTETVEGDTDFTEEGAGAVFADRSGVTLYASAEAQTAARMNAVAQGWRDFEVQQSTTGDTGETIEFQVQVSWAYRFSAFFGSAEINYTMELYDLTNGTELLETVPLVFESVSGIAGGPDQEESDTVTAELNEFTEAGNTYRFQFNARAYGAATNPLSTLFGHGLADSATGENRVTLQAFDGHLAPEDTWSYTWKE
jgi:hypothetical protein